MIVDEELIEIIDVLLDLEMNNVILQLDLAFIKQVYLLVHRIRGSAILHLLLARAVY